MNICGVDEAGRGALAGPIVAGAVILPEDFPIAELADSKKLTDARRRELLIIIKEKCDWAAGFSPAEEVDQLGVKKATREAMWRAIQKLKSRPPHAPHRRKRPFPIRHSPRRIYQRRRPHPDDFRSVNCGQSNARRLHDSSRQALSSIRI